MQKTGSLRTKREKERNVKGRSQERRRKKTREFENYLTTLTLLDNYLVIPFRWHCFQALYLSLLIMIIINNKLYLTGFAQS